MSLANYPDFSQLPLDKNGPNGNAWGLWGPDDQLGTLNLLTDDVVLKAVSESIKTGQRLSLNWGMNAAANPKFARKLLDLNLINKAPLKHAHDDEWTFNSQCSSQWDGLRHYAYQKEGLYYMGRRGDDFAASTEPNSIHHVSKKGIAGRAIFIDWYRWAQTQGIQVDGTSAHEIPFEQLVEALKSQSMDLDVIRPGDILVIRSGYLAQYQEMTDAKRESLNERYKTHKPENIGLKPSEELLEFLWNQKIAAICGDARSMEVWPCRDLEFHLHEWLLAGWGMPIGELFYLEELSKLCNQLGRYTFFLSSSPMNVPGAVASPPNALAFF